MHSSRLGARLKGCDHTTGEGRPAPFAAVEVAFFDERLEDVAELLAAMRPGVIPIALRGSAPAPAQMAAVLQGISGLEAVHVLAHGAPGEVRFSAGSLTTATLGAHADDLATVGRALRSGGQLVLWSCRTGEGLRGAAFARDLEAFAGVEVVAAPGFVGTAARGGTWRLSARSGLPLRPPLTDAGIAAYPGLLAVSLDLDTAAAGTNASTTFYEQTPVRLFQAVSLSTNGGSKVDVIVATLSGAGTGETLGLDSAGAALASSNGITVSFAADTGALTLRGNGQADSVWAELLNHIEYANPAENPAGQRTISIAAASLGDSSSALTTDVLSLVPVNDAPTGADKSVTIQSGRSYTLTLADFGFADPKDMPANGMLGIQVGVLGANAMLTLDGQAVAAGTTVSTADIAAGKLVLAPAVGYSTANFTFRVQDDGGTANGGSDLAAVANSFSLSVNTAPTATITPVSYNATENTALSLKGTGLSVSDPDGGQLKVTLTVGEGVLSSAAGTTGVTVAGSGTSTLTLTGTASQLSTLFNTGGSGTLTYTETLDNPSASTTLSMTVVDSSGATSPADTATINIAAVNDAPSNTVPARLIDTVDTPIAVTGLSIRDLDAGTATTLTTTLTVRHGTLAVGAVADGAAVTNSGTASVKLTGSVAQINATLAALNNVVYTPAAGYTGDDWSELTMLTNDGGNTGSGGAKSASSTVRITVGAPPVVDLNGAAAGTGASAAFQENAGAVLIAPQGTVSDADTPVLGWTGWLRVAYSGGAQTGDVLSVRNQGTGAGQISFDGTYVWYNDPRSGFGYNKLGQVDAVNNGQNGKDLVINFGVNGINANWATSTSVSALLQNITFASTSDTPSPAPRTLSVTVNDGGYTPALYLTSDPAVTTVTVTPMNDAPTLSTHIGSASYTEGGLPVRLLPTLTMADPDQPASFAGASVRVSLDGGVAGDEIVLADGSGVSVTNGVVSVGGKAVGMVSDGALAGGSSHAAVTFTQDATQADVNALLQALAYDSTSSNPTTQTRTATIVFNDGGNTGGGGPLQDFASVAITVSTTNTPAVIGDPTGASVTEDVGVTAGGDLVAQGSIPISDPDSPPLFRTTVDSAPGNLGTLDLSQSGAYTYTVANSAVQTLGAGQTKDEVFTIKAVDGTAKSVTFTINGTNDAPTAVDDSGTATETGVATGTPATGTVLGNDTDVDRGDNLVVTGVSGANGMGTVGAALAGRYGVLTLSADGSYVYAADDDAAAVDALAPDQTLVDSFDYTVSDGHGGSASARLDVLIAGANDAPRLGTDKWVVSQGTTVQVPVSALLANDSDPDQGDVLSVVSVGSATGCSVSLNNGVVTLVANAASASFQYTVRDSHQATSSGMVTISGLVTTLGNDAPVIPGDISVAFVDAQGGNDVLSGGGSALTVLMGGAGADTLNGSAGADSLIGGAGSDVYLVNSIGDMVVENFGEGTDAVNTTLSVYALSANVENLTYTGSGSFKGTGNDVGNRITGGAGNDVLAGGAGGDTLSGGGGDDTLIGGTGLDRLAGDGGNDLFFIDSLSDGMDIIADFQSGADRIGINAAAFGFANSSSLPEALSANTFLASRTGMATSASQRFLYNTTTATLYYDADGSGAGTAVPIERFSAGTTLTANDFWLFAGGPQSF